MSEERKSMLERRQDRAAIRDAVPALVVLLATEAMVAVIDPDPGEHAWHVAIMLSPVLAALWLAWAQVRALRRTDEFQRIVYLEALAVGFAVTVLVAFSGSLLVVVDVGTDAMFLQLTVIGGVISWVTALAVLGRR